MSRALSRVEERRGFSNDVRLRLLEKDADDCEASSANVESKLDRLLWAVIVSTLSIIAALVVRL